MNYYQIDLLNTYVINKLCFSDTNYIIQTIFVYGKSSSNTLFFLEYIYNIIIIL